MPAYAHVREHESLAARPDQSRERRDSPHAGLDSPFTRAARPTRSELAQRVDAGMVNGGSLHHDLAVPGRGGRRVPGREMGGDPGVYSTEPGATAGCIAASRMAAGNDERIIMLTAHAFMIRSSEKKNGRPVRVWRHGMGDLSRGSTTVYDDRTTATLAPVMARHHLVGSIPGLPLRPDMPPGTSVASFCGGEEGVTFRAVPPPVEVGNERGRTNRGKSRAATSGRRSSPMRSSATVPPFSTPSNDTRGHRHGDTLFGASLVVPEGEPPARLALSVRAPRPVGLDLRSPT